MRKTREKTITFLTRLARIHFTAHGKIIVIALQILVTIFLCIRLTSLIKILFKIKYIEITAFPVAEKMVIIEKRFQWHILTKLKSYNSMLRF